MGSCGRSWRNERRESVPDEDAPAIVTDDVLESAAGEGKSSDVACAVEASEDNEEDVVGQIRKSRGHSSLFSC